MAQKKIGAKIVIDGEQEFRSALVQSKNALKEFDSELKLVTSQFKNNEKSMEALRAKQAVYQKQQQELAKQSKLLVDQIQKASAEYKKAADVQEQQAAKIKKLEKALEEAKKEYGDSSEEVQKLEQELTEANEEYAKQERCIEALNTKISRWNTDLNNTKRELVETDRALEETTDSIENYDANLNAAERETEEFGETMGKAGANTETLRVSLGSLVSAQVVVDVLRNCARAIKEVATAAIDVGGKFEASMSKVEALSGASGDSLARLSDKAKEMGKSTIYSASESADAFSYMALAGWKVEEMLEGIEPVLNLAASANMDLAEASDIVTDYITAFGLKAEDAAHFSDAMATAMSTSNTTVEELGEAYKNVAATCGSMGIAMEDATAVLSTMANAGVKGAEAGTALNSILTRIATNTNGAADKLKEYGVEVYDAEGKMNSISSILNGVADAWGYLSQEEQATLAKTVAGVRQYSKFQTIMLGVSDAAKEGGQSFDDYAESLRNCDGAAEAMAKTMQDNLTGDITILKSALEGLGIATEGAFDDAFRESVQGATEAVSRLEDSITNGDLGVSLSNLGEQLAYLADELITATTEALPGFIDGLSWLIDNIDYIGAGIKTVIAGFATYKIATVAATISTEGFTAALLSNPIGAVAVAITTAAVAIYEFCDASYEAARSEDEVARRSEELIHESERLNKSIDDSRMARIEEKVAIESQAIAAKKLISQLFDEKTAQSDRLRIVAELKSIYPELNIEIDEEGRLIGATRQELEKYIDTSLKLAKVEAAKEHLAQIAKEQFEAEQELVKIENQLADAEAKAKRAEADNAVAQHRPGINVGEYFGAEAAKDQYEELQKQADDTKENIETLGAEYKRTMEYIDNNEPLVKAAESTEELAESEEKAKQASEELAKEFDELEESIRSSIESSLDLTNRWSQEWATSTSEMTKNVDSQIEGIENWSKNFNKLANNAEVQLDQRVLKYIADMGIEGAGLVQELVNTLEKSPEELQGFSDSMAKYLTLEDSVATRITGSYIGAIENGLSGASSTAEQATQQMHDNIAAQMTNVGHDAVSSTQTAIEDGTDGVVEASENVGEGIIEGVTEATGENGEKLEELGTTFDSALADGLRKDAARKAAEEQSEKIYNAYANVLTSDAGYEIGSTFMGGMLSAVQEQGAALIELAKSIAAQMRAILNAPLSENKSGGNGGNGEGGEEGGGGGGGRGGSPNASNPNAPRPVNINQPAFNMAPSRMTNSYADMADSIERLGEAFATGMADATGTTQVNVELSGSASDIFNVVRNQNTKLVTATGYHALG